MIRTDELPALPRGGPAGRARRRVQIRVLVVLAVLVVVTGAVYGLLLQRTRAYTSAVRAAGAEVVELRERAEGINAIWDEQEGVLEDEERASLFGQIEQQLAAIVDDTGALADRVRALAIPPAVADTDHAAFFEAVDDMVSASEQMLAGLRAPGRSNKDERLTGLEGYSAAADVARQAVRVILR